MFTGPETAARRRSPTNRWLTARRVIDSDFGDRNQKARSILIAEDNPDSRDALRALLEAYGFHVLEAENGQEAVRRGIEQKPDLILMDIMMPTMDGLQATRTLRGSPAFRQVPILALTAMAGSRDLAIQAGCDDYLSKPIDIANFMTKIRRWLDESAPS
jgi:two-component system, cell cycle response regulator DivK